MNSHLLLRFADINLHLSRIVDELLTPLFGTGEVVLTDPPLVASTATKDIEKGAVEKSYGAISTSKPSKLTNANDKTEQIESSKAKSAKGKVYVDPETLKPHIPHQNACLWLFHLLEGVAVAAAIALMATQLLPFILPPNSSSRNGSSTAQVITMGVLTIALRGYITLFCVLCIMTELGMSWVHRTLPLLQFYLSRGFLYSFLGLMCAEEAYSERVKEIALTTSAAWQHLGWASIFMEVSAWCMLAIGIVYMLLGVCCCKRVRDHYQQIERDAWKKYKEDLIEWKRQWES
jgi:hypothetical protein